MKVSKKWENSIKSFNHILLPRDDTECVFSDILKEYSKTQSVFFLIF